MFRLSPQHAIWIPISTCLLLLSLLIALTWHADSTHATYTHQSVVSLGALRPTMTTARQTYWQVGVVAGGDGQHVSAMRTRIRTHLPHTVADKTTDYFWIGSYLADGSFIQIGYAIPWYDAQPRWFFCAFDPNGTKMQCPLGEPQSAGPAEAWHSYTLIATRVQPDHWLWVAQIDDHVIGSIPEQVGSTGVATPGVFVEQSAFAPHAATNDLGPVEFSPAIEVVQGGASTTHFTAATTGNVAYSTLDVCPPYGVGLAGKNDVLLGTDLPCLPAGTYLW